MVLRRSFKRFAALLLAATLLPAPAEAGTPKNVLVVGLNMVNITSLDPHNANSTETSHFVANVYDNLVKVDPLDSNKLLPMAAESWEEKPDGTIVFHLRKDITFHSGNKMTAKDAEYSMRRVVKLGLIGASYFVQWGYTAQNVDAKFYAPDEYTFVMEPAMPLAPRLKLFLLARLVGPVLDSKLVQSNEKDGDLGKAWLAANAAGSGPYLMTTFNPNDIMTLTANKNYWDGKAKLERVVVRHLPESQVERLLLEKGDLDVGLQLASADIDSLDANPSIVIDRIPGAGFFYFAVNLRDPDFAKAGVRRAVRHAIDYQGINATVLKNYGSMTESMIPEGVPGYQPGLGNKYDPELAKKELADAGYPNGMTKQLLVLSSPPYSDMATVIQQNLAKIGITAEIRTGNGDQTYGPMRKRTFECGVGRTTINTPADPDGWVRSHVYNPDNSDAAGLSSLQGWRQSVDIPEITALVDQAAASSDEALRAELYAKAVKIYEDFAPAFIPVSRCVDPYARSVRVKNYHASPVSMTRWNNVEKAD